jgi:hypothetical protein
MPLRAPALFPRFRQELSLEEKVRLRLHLPEMGPVASMFNYYRRVAWLKADIFVYRVVKMPSLKQ